MPEEKLLAKNIRYYREAAGMTQDDLANELNLGSRTTLSNWESAYSTPDAEMLPLIANALHVSIDELFMGTYRNIDHKDSDDNSDLCLADEIIQLIKYARHINLETANRCRQAIADELAERVEQERQREQIMAEEISFPLFLCEGDTDYFEMKEKTRELRRLKRKNAISYFTLRNDMNLINHRYDELICIAYYYMILSGEKVPSRQLYEHMRGVLSRKVK